MNPQQGSAARVYFRYALPAVLGLLAVSSASVVDGIFVGNYIGSDALAALNLCFPVISLVFGYAFMLAIGGSVMAGKFLGEGEPARASDIFSRCMLALIVSALVLSTAGWLGSEQLLTVLGADQATEPVVTDYARNYLLTTLLLIPAGAISLTLFYFMQVDGRPAYANFTLIVGAASNVVLDWLLILHLEMGVTGAALATGLSQCIALALLLPHNFSAIAKLRWRLSRSTGRWRDVLTAAFNGSSEFANEASVGITTLLFNWVMLSRFGVDGVAAYAVIGYIFYVGVMASFALADSLPPPVSYCLGARDPKRIAELLRIALLSSAVVGLLIAGCLLLYPDSLILMFVDPSEQRVIELCREFIALCWPAFLLLGANLCAAAYCTAMHKPIASGAVALLRSMLLPALGLWLLPPLLGDTGVFIAIPVAELLTLLTIALLAKRYLPERLISSERKANSQ